MNSEDAMGRDTERPRCYGTYEKESECVECDIREQCASYTGRLNSKTRGLSRSRAIRAFCYECNGGTNHAPDCEDRCCPLYPFRRKNEGEPVLWWAEPTSTWFDGSQVARKEMRKQRTDDVDC